MCSDTRQGFILLSDTLGVSMLVDAINHRLPGRATETTVLGPFYVQAASPIPANRPLSPHLAALFDDARQIKAVNTIVLKDGRSFGYNNDWPGFAELFRWQMGDLPHRKVVQLGLGGAGGAVAHAALKGGVDRLTLFDLNPDRAAGVVSD
jgi:shikimate 5-dehydrogenase